jgi:predicted small lipoprotein YifL
MPKRMVAIVLAVLLSLAGCHVKKVQQLPPTSVAQPEKETIVGVTTLKGEQVSFDPPGASIRDNALHASVKKTPYELPLDQVQRFWVQRQELDKARTIGLVAAVVIGTIAVVALVIAKTKNSCPFVYSWDGTQYVFDAEPYGGAITRGLQKDDFTQLEKLREQDGLYRLRLTNEVDETQFTNLTELWVVDHPAGTRVVPDVRGNLHTLAAPHSLLSARDASGRDLLPWLRATDRLIWEPPAVPNAEGKLEDDIIMTFPKPPGVTQAKLIANVATGLWGSYMIKRMVELRGRDVGAWYTLMDQSQSARDDLFAWEVREQLYALKIYVEEPTGWEARGVLPGVGPFISKDRILPLDVSRVRGDQLRIRIHPPAGFWALNSFAVDYSADRPVHVQTLQPQTARGFEGKDVREDLAGTDDRYLAMPNVGDTADLTFSAPSHPAGTDRTIFLHSRGYYRLHLVATGEPDTKTLHEIENVPGAAARFAADHFAQWQIAQQKSQ